MLAPCERVSVRLQARGRALFVSIRSTSAGRSQDGLQHALSNQTRPPQPQARHIGTAGSGWNRPSTRTMSALSTMRIFDATMPPHSSAHARMRRAAKGAAAVGAEWSASSLMNAVRCATTVASTAQATASKSSDVAVEPTNSGTFNGSLSGTIDNRAGSSLTSGGEQSRLDASGEAATSANMSASKDGLHASGSATGDRTSAIRK